MNYDYIAGFFDGEGSVCAQRAGNNVHFKLDISNTNKEVLEKIKEFLDNQGIKSSLYTRKLYEGRKQAYDLVICNKKDILEVLFNIMCKVIVKRPQVEYLLTHISLLMGGNNKFNIVEYRALYS